MSWITQKMEEKQEIAERRWVTSERKAEQQPLRSVDDAWKQLAAAIARDVREFNTLALCEHQVEVFQLEDRLEVRWQNSISVLLVLELHGQTIRYVAGPGNGRSRNGVFVVRFAAPGRAVLEHQGKLLEFEEASRLLLQPILLP